MKTHIKNLFLLPALIVGLGLTPAGRVTAQTFTNLHNFTGGSSSATLILSGNTLYGTEAGQAGSSDNGTVFAVNTDGTAYTNVYNFTAGNYNSSNGLTNSDGATPVVGVILSGNTLYGTAGNGGLLGGGTVFKVNTDGTGFTNLHSFTNLVSATNSDGSRPHAALILSGNTLYGTAFGGGSSGNGTVFKVNTNGTGFTNLHTFTGTPEPFYTNSDGANPMGGLILSGSTLYGTASLGGSSANGTVFKVNTDGTGFTNLHTFTEGFGSFLNTNSDGTHPHAGLILSGNTLYGTAAGGGSAGNGTVFAVNTNGTGFTNLHSFTAVSDYNVNSDGLGPEAELILSGNTLYGTAGAGGSSRKGTVFAVNTDGTAFTTLYSFTDIPPGYFSNSDGAGPETGLLLSGNTLYGITVYGGDSGYGTVFSLSWPPPLAIVRSEANVVLTWATTAAEFTLQSTTNLDSPVVWETVSPAPVVVNGLNAVTNPASEPQQFYRLSQ